jgi:hypothetical protein
LTSIILSKKEKSLEALSEPSSFEIILWSWIIWGSDFQKRLSWLAYSKINLCSTIFPSLSLKGCIKNKMEKIVTPNWKISTF